MLKGSSPANEIVCVESGLPPDKVTTILTGCNRDIDRQKNRQTDRQTDR